MIQAAPGTRALFGGEMEAQSPWGSGSSRGLHQLTRGSDGGTWTASGRAALALILKQLRRDGVRHVHLPALLCESLLAPVKAQGMEHSFYPVDGELAAAPEPPSGSAVILVHYFGWPNPAGAELRASSARGDVVLLEDLSHAALGQWTESIPHGALRFLSARKLGPAPLGGWCSMEAEPEEPTMATAAMMWRSLAARLIKADYLRHGGAPVEQDMERLYLGAFQAVEAYLDSDPGALGAPAQLTGLLEGIDWDAAARRRRDNWVHLHEALAGKVEPLMSHLPDDVVPLGYLIRLAPGRRDEVRRALAARRVFCPVHWPLPGEVDAARFPEAHQLSRTLLTIPMDQRYDPRDMEHLADLVASEVSRT